MSEAKYIEIAKEIERLIDIGHYTVDSKLPTHRALADKFTTTPVTIAKAYKVLTENDRIESFVGRGSFVKGQPQLKQVIQSQFEENEWNFSILQPCYAEHVDRLHSRLQQSFSQLDNPTLYGYTENTGFMHHREAGMRWLQHYGLQLRTAEQVLLTNGAQHALSILIELYTKAGDYIAVEAQTYPGILSITRQLGRKVIGVKMDTEGMCPQSLEKVCKQHHPSMVIVVPSHQNPTGATMPLSRREAIAKVVQSRSVWLVEDDIYGFLNPTPIPAITNFLPEKSFYINSLSKAISPGMRCGFIKSPQSQVNRLVDFIRSSIWLSSPFMFEVASNLIVSGDAFEMAIQQQAIAKRRQILARKILSGFNMQSQETSFHLWLTLPDGWQADDFVATAKERGMLVSSGSFFSTEETNKQYIRLSLMAIADEEQLRLGLVELRNLLNSRS